MLFRSGGEAPNTEGEGKKKRYTGYQRKLYRYEQQIAELNAKLAERDKPKSLDKPVIDNFQTHDEYVEAISRWTHRQEFERENKQREEIQAKQKQQQELERWQEKIDALPDEYDDYEYVVGRAFNNVQIHPLVVAAIKETERPEIAYQLGKDLELRDKILNMTPTQAIKEIAKLEAQLQNKPTVKVSKSSEPITPVKGRATSVVNLESMESQDYIKQRYPHLFKRK